MVVSKNSGTPKSSILIGFSIINHPFLGTPIFGNPLIGLQKTSEVEISSWKPGVRFEAEIVSFAKLYGAQGVVGAWYFHGTWLFHLFSVQKFSGTVTVISPKILLGRWVFQKTEGGTLLFFWGSVSVCLCERNMITKGCGFRSWRCHDGRHHYHPDHFL